MNRARKGALILAAVAVALIVITARMWMAHESESAFLARVNGLWRSEGYGLEISIAGRRVSAFEVTSISVQPAWDAMTQIDRSGSGRLVFLRNGCERSLSIEAPSVLRLHSTCSSADVRLHSIQAHHSDEESKAAITPERTFAVFWQTMAELYPFFDAHQVDWAAVDRASRPKAAAATSDRELFDVIRATLEPLRDGHVSLNAPGLTFKGARTELLSLQDFQAYVGRVLPGFVKGELKSFCNDKIWFGTMDDGVGYLLITAFLDFARGGVFDAQRQALERALEQILHEADALHGLVIDLRFNGGGYNALGVAVASRFTTKRYLAYSVKARSNVDGPVTFTEPQSIWIEPGPRPLFSRPIVVLAGPNCISACETFLMALMGRAPAVTIVGDNTQGVFSEVVERSLPNGWRLSLPTEIYSTADGRSFDVLGIAPHVRQPFLPRVAGDNGRDSSIEKALEILRR